MAKGQKTDMAKTLEQVVEVAVTHGKVCGVIFTESCVACERNKPPKHAFYVLCAASRPLGLHPRRDCHRNDVHEAPSHNRAVVLHGMNAAGCFDRA